MLANLEDVRMKLKSMQKDTPTKDLSSLFEDLHKIMSQIGERLNSAPENILTEDDKKQWSSIESNLDGFVKNNLSQAPGEKMSSYGDPVQLAGTVPMEAGANPNAQPMPDMG